MFFFRYTIYPLTKEVAEQKVWMDSTSLLVVCGSVPDTLRKMFVEFFLSGGHIISLCSEFFNEFFPGVQVNIFHLNLVLVYKFLSFRKTATSF